MEKRLRVIAVLLGLGSCMSFAHWLRPLVKPAIGFVSQKPKSAIPSRPAPEPETVSNSRSPRTKPNLVPGQLW